MPTPSPIVARLAAAFVILAACSDPATTSGDGDLVDTSRSDVPLFPDVPSDASVDAAADTTVDSSDTSRDTVGDTAPPLEDTPADPCATANCNAPNRGVCIPDPMANTYTCACDPGHALDGDTCVSTACDAERFRTWLTVHDMTPLPNTTNPVRVGFDPLLPTDRVRVVVELEKLAGSRASRVVVFTQRLEIDPATVRLDGAPTVLATLPTNRQVALALPASFTSGRLAFDATITAEGAPFVALDARAFTDLNCPIDGSASGARLQLAGTRDPKGVGCNDVSDLRSVQLTDAIPDKDTSVYETRNGTFAAISNSYKVLTQMTLCLQRTDDRAVSLAGSADGTRPWTIDNFLLIEAFSSDPADTTVPATRTDAWLTTSAGANAPSAFADGGVIRIANHASLPGDYTGSRTPSAFTFPAGVVSLDRILPVGERVWLRFTGLDTGVAGHMSRLFITSSEPDAAPHECRSFLDCPLPTSNNGSAIAIRSGCIEGACTPVACGSGCALGQRCVQGFCTDGCDNAQSCPSGETCNANRCVAVTPGLSEGDCRTFADCPLGEVCFFGRCEAGCFHPVSQSPTYADNNTTYSLCKTNPAACPRCPVATDRCWYNYCRACELDAHCPSGQVCADYACVAP